MRSPGGRRVRRLRSAHGSHEAAALPRPVLVLAGRPNVGKSTLFNRIVGHARSMVEATPGVTRDRLLSSAEWAGERFTVMDTGGLGGTPEDPFGPAISAQAEVGLTEADCVLFIVDARQGLLPEDRRIADQLRRLRVPVVVVANKCDRPGETAEEFYALGLGEPMPVSAIRGEGLGDVLDAVLEAARQSTAGLQATEEVGPGDAPVRVAFVGRPNVGKSSLVNRLVGSERLIVSDLAGTTRDAIDVPWSAAGRDFVLVDTPGLRRPARIARASLEDGSARRSRDAIARAEVAALVLDCGEPCTDQDKRIAGLALDHRVALVVILNKRDQLAGGSVETVEDNVREAMPFLSYAIVTSCSAKTGLGLAHIAPALARAADAYRSRISTPKLNACIRAAIAARPPAAHEGKPVRIYYAAQVGVAPPTVVLLTNAAHAVSREYARYLENQMRARFTLVGTPLRLVFRVRAHRRLIKGAGRMQ